MKTVQYLTVFTKKMQKKKKKKKNHFNNFCYMRFSRKILSRMWEKVIKYDFFYGKKDKVRLEIFKVLGKSAELQGYSL